MTRRVSILTRAARLDANVLAVLVFTVAAAVYGSALLVRPVFEAWGVSIQTRAAISAQRAALEIEAQERALEARTAYYQASWFAGALAVVGGVGLALGAGGALVVNRWVNSARLQRGVHLLPSPDGWRVVDTETGHAHALTANSAPQLEQAQALAALEFARGEGKRRWFAEIVAPALTVYEIAQRNREALPDDILAALPPPQAPR